MPITGALQVTARSNREIVMTRSFAAPRAQVFDAWTTPALMKRWLWGPDEWPLVECTVDLRVGGRSRLVWRSADGKAMAMTGVYQEIVRPERLSQTELFDEDWTGGEALSTLVFTESGDGTRVTLTVRYASEAARDAVLQSPMADGMEQCYIRLDGLLADGAERDVA